MDSMKMNATKKYVTARQKHEKELEQSPAIMSVNESRLGSESRESCLGPYSMDLSKLQRRKRPAVTNSLTCRPSSAVGSSQLVVNYDDGEDADADEQDKGHQSRDMNKRRMKRTRQEQLEHIQHATLAAELLSAQNEELRMRLDLALSWLAQFGHPPPLFPSRS